MTALVTPVADEGLGNTSWIVDIGDRRLAVVDPGRHPGPFLAEAERRGARVAFSIETHLHADFVTGSRELAAFGATVLASAQGGLAWPHRPLAPGDTVDLGGLSLRALPTPGHTPEHLAYLLADGDDVLGVFTGGSLLVGAVARTDLIAPDATEDLARALWRSLQKEILTLPAETRVYPTHGAGSFCSAPATDRRWTTVGDERRHNPLLAAEDEDAFVKALLAGLGSYPRYFEHLRELNRRGPEILGVSQPTLPALDLAAFRGELDRGAVLVDTRPVEAWSAGHIPGALAIPLRDQFASWLGWLVERGQPVVFVVGADQDRGELMRQCHQIGYENIVGELAGGTTAWLAAGLDVRRTPVVDAARIEGRVLDVRQDSEYFAGHLPEAVHIELGLLAQTANEVERPDAVMCGHGERAATAASLLERASGTSVPVVIGGPIEWSAATGQPLVEQ
ncbi:MAG TPA: rhodanese-like domain-containing protein [Acidimicrobiia bacterium]|nr:rhodanese-like domain-containing protein [Acidimicrobiia bacterium]